MIEFGRRTSEGTPQKKGLEGMSGMQLLGRYYMEGLQPHLARAQELLQQQERVHDDSARLNDIVQAIQIEINGISGTDIGNKVTRDDVIEYVRTKIVPKEL